jgi:hypothetical protein
MNAEGAGEAWREEDPGRTPAPLTLAPLTLAFCPEPGCGAPAEVRPATGSSCRLPRSPAPRRLCGRPRPAGYRRERRAWCSRATGAEMAGWSVADEGRGRKAAGPGWPSSFLRVIRVVPGRVVAPVPVVGLCRLAGLPDAGPVRGHGLRDARAVGVLPASRAPAGGTGDGEQVCLLRRLAGSVSGQAHLHRALPPAA